MSEFLTQSNTDEKIKIGDPGRWTVERKFRFVGKQASSLPYSVLLLDRQHYLAQGACFVRHVRQIHHLEAAKNLRRINIPFASDRESLTIHWIRIWRGGEPSDQVHSPEDIEIITDDGQPGRHIARITLKLLTADDALDVAYTTKANQVTRSFTAVHPIRQRTPVVDWHLSAIVPPEMPLSHWCGEMEIEPTVRQLAEGSQFHHWTLKDTPTMTQFDKVPTWYRTNSEIQLSNITCWPKVVSEVNRRWGRQTICPTGKATANNFSDASGGDLWEAARRASLFVQDEIANLTTSEPIHSPVEPSSKVLEAKGGDAKSKACLLVDLLREIGVPAAPVLVSRSRKKSLVNCLPSPELFDHVIVRGRIGDQDFWVDPCATHQGGAPGSALEGNFALGLQISARSRGLSPIPNPEPTTNVLTIREHFRIDDDSGAHLDTRTEATGTEANSIRRQVAEAGLEEFFARRLADLLLRYPGATIAPGNPCFEDDRSNNQIVIEDSYEIPNILVGEKDSAFFTPGLIRRKLPGGVCNGRSAPLSLCFPCNIRQLTVIDTPWDVEPGESSASSPGTGFTFSLQQRTEGKRHTLRYAYSTLDDHLVPVDFPSIQIRLDNLRPHLNYRFLPPAARAGRSQSGKGSRILREATKQPPQRKRKSNVNQNSAMNLLLPIAAAVAAIALFLVIKSAFKTKATETSEAIMEEKIAETATRGKDDKPAPAVSIPDNPLEFLPPPSPLPGPGGFDDLEFGLGDGSTDVEKASDKKNAISSDWKLSK